MIEALWFYGGGNVQKSKIEVSVGLTPPTPMSTWTQLWAMFRTKCRWAGVHRDTHGTLKNWLTNLLVQSERPCRQGTTLSLSDHTQTRTRTPTPGDHTWRCWTPRYRTVWRRYTTLPRDSSSRTWLGRLIWGFCPLSPGSVWLVWRFRCYNFVWTW